MTNFSFQGLSLVCIETLLRLVRLTHPEGPAGMPNARLGSGIQKTLRFSETPGGPAREDGPGPWNPCSHAYSLSSKIPGKQLTSGKNCSCCLERTQW